MLDPTKLSPSLRHPLFLGILLALLAYLCDLIIESAANGSADVGRVSYALALGLYTMGVAYCLLVKGFNARVVAIAVALGLLCGLIFYWRLFPTLAYSGEAIHAAVGVFGVLIACAWIRVRLDHGVWVPDYSLWYHTLTGVFLALALALGAALGAASVLLAFAYLIQALGHTDWLAEHTSIARLGVLLSLVAGATLGYLQVNNQPLFSAYRFLERSASWLMWPLVLALWLVVLVTATQGFGPMWQSREYSSLVLLGSSVLIVVLVNFLLRDGVSPVTRWRLTVIALLIIGSVAICAMALAGVSARIDQYGFTPKRLMAFGSGALMLMVALVYLLALLLSRVRGFGAFSQSNGWLVLGVMVFCVLQTLPLIDLGKWSARQQLARLNQGEVKPAKFDVTAMRYDFGPSGVAMTKELAKAGNAQAELALDTAERVEFADQAGSVYDKLSRIKDNMVAYSMRDSIPEALIQELADENHCQENICALHFPLVKDQALLTELECRDLIGERCFVRQVLLVEMASGLWRSHVIKPAIPTRVERSIFNEMVRAGKLNVEMARALRLNLDGKAIGAYFEWQSD